MTCADDCTHEIPRQWVRRNGRNEHCPVVNGQVEDRVSSVAKITDDTANLDRWRQRNVARALGLHGDLLEMVLAAGNDDKELDGVLKQAADRIGSKAAANRGTALHAAVAQVNRTAVAVQGLGKDTTASLDAYRRMLDDHHLRPVYVEQFVSLQQIGIEVGGSFDVVLEDETGARFMADIKTGAKSWERVYSHSLAVQLASYQMGSRYCPVEGWLPDHGADDEVGLLIALPVGKGVCHLDTVDLAAGRQGLQVSLELAQWRSRSGLAHPVELVSP